jgi:hypothetical protein
MNLVTVDPESLSVEFNVYVFLEVLVRVLGTACAALIVIWCLWFGVSRMLNMIRALVFYVKVFRMGKGPP